MNFDDLIRKKYRLKKVGRYFYMEKCVIAGIVVQIQSNRWFYYSFGFCFYQFTNCCSNRKI